MPLLNRCGLGGSLTSAREPLPAAAFEYDHAALPRRGCNRLRCPTCGELVRHEDHQRVGTAMAPADAAALYARESVAGSPMVSPARDARLYLCRCRAWVQSRREDALADPDPDSLPQRMGLAWRCAGHPPLTLPAELDGVTVTVAALPRLCAEALGGWSPPGAAPADRSGVAWAARLHARLAGTEWADAVDSACTRALADASDEVQARARALLATIPLPASTMRLRDGKPLPVAVPAGSRPFDPRKYSVPAEELQRLRAFSRWGLGSLDELDLHDGAFSAYGFVRRCERDGKAFVVLRHSGGWALEVELTRGCMGELNPLAPEDAWRLAHPSAPST